MAELLDAYVFVDTGPEAVAGSRRSKAGTAQKLAFNGFSTALMIRLGKTYSNLMVDAAPSNARLRGGVLVIIEEATGASEAECRKAPEAAGGETKTAIVSRLADTDATTARAALEASNHRVRDALAALGATRDRATGQTAEVPMEG